MVRSGQLIRRLLRNRSARRREDNYGAVGLFGSQRCGSAVPRMCNTCMAANETNPPKKNPSRTCPARDLSCNDCPHSLNASRLYSGEEERLTFTSPVTRHHPPHDYYDYCFHPRTTVRYASAAAAFASPFFPSLSLGRQMRAYPTNRLRGLNFGWPCRLLASWEGSPG